MPTQWRRWPVTADAAVTSRALFRPVCNIETVKFASERLLTPRTIRIGQKNNKKIIVRVYYSVTEFRSRLLQLHSDDEQCIMQS